MLLTLTLGAAPPAQTQTIVNICDRTPHIVERILEYVSADDCAEVTAEMLAGITVFISNASNEATFSSLQAGDTSRVDGLTGDFAGLTGVTNLTLTHKGMTTLPGGIFRPLISLRHLDLSNNNIATMSTESFTNFQGQLNTLALGPQALPITGNMRVPLYLNQVGNRLEANVPSSAFKEMTFNLIITSSDASSTSPTTATITVPLGENSAEIHLTPQAGEILTASFADPPVSFNNLRIISDSSLPVFETFTYLERIPGFCNRTSQVQAALIAAIAGTPAKTCHTITNNDLATIDTLDLAGGGITSLRSGDFDGLTAVTAIDLSKNSLTGLPTNIFSDLTTLQTLDLNSNSITGLQAASFDDLTALTTLDLSGNSLTGLPAGAFNALTALSSLDLSENDMPILPNNTFNGLASALTTLDLSKQTDDDVDMRAYLYLNQDSDHNVTLTFPAGAPAVLTVNLIANGSPISISIPAGATSKTQQLTVASNTLTVGFASTSPVVHGTLTLTGEDFLLAVDPAFGFCNRTPAVRDGLLALVSANDCRLVTRPMLTGISTAVDLSNSSIGALKAGDFADLSSVPQLNLSGNSLATLPAGIFSGLTAVTQLNLSGNSIATLPAGAFSGLPAMTLLNLSGNSLATLPAGIFGGLSATTQLNLSGNSIDTLTAGIFSGLSAMTQLNLSGNSLATLPASVFSGLPALVNLDLSGNEFSNLPDDTFKDLTTALTTLDLSNQTAANNATPMRLNLRRLGNTVTATIPSATFATTTVNLTVSSDNASVADITQTITIPLGQTKANTTLVPTSGDTLTAVFANPALTFTGITPTGLVIPTPGSELVAGFCSRTAEVRAAIIATIGGSPAKTCAHVTSADLAAITTLDLEGDGITTLQLGDFAGLTAVTEIDLSNNRITTLPQNLFANLGTVTTLKLNSNRIAGLAAGVLNGLPALVHLNLRDNELTDLSDDLFTAKTTALTTLDLSNQTAANTDTSMRLYLSQVGNLVTATLPTGTFAATTVNLTVSSDDANVADITQTISIAVGQTSGSTTLVPTSSDTLTAAFANPILTFANITPAGLTFLTPGNERVTGFCSRTPQVQAALIAAAGSFPAITCGNISSTDLAAITTVDLAGDGITALKDGDFAGLTTVTAMDLSNNSIEALPTEHLRQSGHSNRPGPVGQQHRRPAGEHLQPPARPANPQPRRQQPHRPAGGRLRRPARPPYPRPQRQQPHHPADGRLQRAHRPQLPRPVEQRHPPPAQRHLHGLDQATDHPRPVQPDRRQRRYEDLSVSESKQRQHSDRDHPLRRTRTPEPESDYQKRPSRRQQPHPNHQHRVWPDPNHHHSAANIRRNPDRQLRRHTRDPRHPHPQRRGISPLCRSGARLLRPHPRRAGQAAGSGQHRRLPSRHPPHAGRPHHTRPQRFRRHSEHRIPASRRLRRPHRGDATRPLGQQHRHPAGGRL